MNKVVQEIVREHLAEEILETSQIKGKGQVNEIYVVATSSSKYLVRIDPKESTSSRFKKEAWCMSEAEKLGVLVPKVLAIGLKEDHPYILVSYIEGRHGEDVDKNIQIQVWSKLGEYARRIHSIKVSGYGERMTAPGVFDGVWNEYLDYNISSLDSDDKLLTSGFITLEQSEILKTTFLKLKQTNFNFGLVHHDLSLKNAIVVPNGDVYLLDFGSAEVNVVPHIDMGEVLRSSLDENSSEFESFLMGYGMGRSEFEEIKSDVFRLRLLMCADKVRWALDRRPELIENKVKDLQEALQEFKYY